MREAPVSSSDSQLDGGSFRACVATILELPLEDLPRPGADEDPPTGWTTSRWLGGLGLGLVRVADPASFSWPGPWIARIQPVDSTRSRFVVMYGVPSGVVWDPAGGPDLQGDRIEDGFVLAAADIALARPPLPSAPAGSGTIEAISVASAGGEPVQARSVVRAIAGQGLEGDRYVAGAGTFPSGPPGSALTMIEAEACESFDPPLAPADHRRNIVTRGIDLNRLVGHEFAIGEVQCRGMRLCEPCTVVQRYAGRPVLRALVHRGGLRVDILQDGEIKLGDLVRVVGD
jgi:hypothetical protein